jgi:exosortase
MRESLPIDRKTELLTYSAVLLIFGWWVYDLHFHWNSLPEYQFGWIVLMLVGYLAWDRWDQRPKLDSPQTLWIGVPMVAVGTAFVLLAELYKHGIARTPAASFALSIGCVLFIAAVIGSGRGSAVLRHVSFPLLFMFVAVPLPKVIWNPLVLNLQGLVSALDVELLNLIGIPAQQHGNVIQLPSCVVGVDEACSGVRSLQSSIMAALFIGYLSLRRNSFRTALLFAGIGLALVGNVLRSLYLSLVAHRSGAEALEKIHDTAGWSVLLFTAVGLICLSWLAMRIEKGIGDSPENQQQRVEGTCAVNS